MSNRELAVDRVRIYPSDAKKIRIMAKRKGGKTIPADIIRDLLK